MTFGPAAGNYFCHCTVTEQKINWVGEGGKSYNSCNSCKLTRPRSPAARNAWKTFRGVGMTEFAEDLRHHCRNPRCRMKLTAPVVNPHKAFCTRGCHSSFYLKRCLVCENDKPAGSTARRKLCRRPKCEGRYRKNSAHYSFLGGGRYRLCGERTKKCPIHGH
jgi:hypothetical protein